MKRSCFGHKQTLKIKQSDFYPLADARLIYYSNCAAIGRRDIIMKKILAFLLCIHILLSSLITFVCAEDLPFDDFNPKKPATRAEVAAISGRYCDAYNEFISSAEELS